MKNLDFIKKIGLVWLSLVVLVAITVYFFNSILSGIIYLKHKFFSNETNSSFYASINGEQSFVVKKVDQYKEYPEFVECTSSTEFVNKKYEEAEKNNFNFSILANNCESLNKTLNRQDKINCETVLKLTKVLALYNFDYKQFVTDLFNYTGINETDEEYNGFVTSTNLKDIMLEGITYKILSGVTHPGYCVNPFFGNTFLSKDSDIHGADASFILLLRLYDNKLTPIWGFNYVHSAIEKIIDINKNGKQEIIVNIGNSGMCWNCWKSMILSLTGDKIENLTSQINKLEDLGFYYNDDMVDLDNDGIPEIKALDSRFEFSFGLCHACSPSSYKIYKWVDGAYRDRSYKFKDFYLNSIKDHEKDLEKFGNDQNYSLKYILSTYLDYENAGMKTIGWEKFQEQLKLHPDMYGVDLDFFSEMYNKFGTIVHD